MMKRLPSLSLTLCENFIVHKILTINPNNSHPPKVQLDRFPLHPSPKPATARSPYAVRVESCPRSKGGAAGGTGVTWAVAV